MADMFDRLRAMTIRQLQPRSSGGKGQAGVLVRKEYRYNPDTDMNDVINSSYDISGLRATYALRHLDGELIRMSDVKFYLCPVLLNGNDCPTPLTTDQIQIDGKTYTVLNVTTWNNSGVDCGWQLQLRTG
jgi:hypothetical protein